MSKRILTTCLFSLFLLLIGSAGCFAQTASPSSQGTLLGGINKALVEQNQALAEQNQALAEQVDAYDKRIAEIEETLAQHTTEYDKRKDTHSKITLAMYLFILLLLLLIIYIERRLRTMKEQLKEMGRSNRLSPAEKEQITHLREELERKISTKERELHAEMTAMSMALTSMKQTEEAPAQTAAAEPESEEGRLPFADDEDAPLEEKPRITSDACFVALSTIFARNEQRLVAVEGGVSITTANKWLDAWERNGWVERISRGKYMKTSKGKKIEKARQEEGQES